MKLPNRNQILLALGTLFALGPDLDAAAKWLAASGIPHVTGAVHILGVVALALGGLALAWNRLRPLLALAGLATPPGALAPWVPGKPGDPDAPKPASEANTEPATPAAIAAEMAKGALPKRTVDKGSVEWWTIGLIAGISLLALGAILLWAPPAKAQPSPVLAASSAPARWEGLSYIISDTWTCSPVAALTGYQLNLKTETFQQGVSLGAGVGCRYTGWRVPLTIEGVGSFSANSNAPNAAQGNLIFVVADNFGIGPGTQIFKDPVTGSYTGQMLVSFFLTGSWASTVAQAKQMKVKAMRAQQQVDEKAGQ